MMDSSKKFLFVKKLTALIFAAFPFVIGQFSGEGILNEQDAHKDMDPYNTNINVYHFFSPSLQNDSFEILWEEIIDLPELPEPPRFHFSDLVAALMECGMDKISVLTPGDGYCSDVTGKTEGNETLKNPGAYRLSQIALHNLLEALHTASIPTQHFSICLSEGGQSEGDKHLQEILWASYNESFRFFVWIAEKPWDILRAAEKVFQRQHRGRGALMPHSIRFLLVGLESPQVIPPDPDWTPHSHSFFTSLLPHKAITRPQIVEETEPFLALSQFDNVLLVPCSRNDSCERCYDVILEKPFSLVWRKNRTRKFDAVDEKWNDVKNKPKLTTPKKAGGKGDCKQNCALFPNIRFNLNGRHLIILAKEWPPYLTADVNEKPGGYGGFLADVIEGLSQEMNFSYTLTPDPATSRSFSLRQLEVKLGTNLEADLMARLYYVTSPMVYNQSVTHPIVMANMSGAYFLHPSNTLWGTLKLLQSDLFGGLGVGLFMFTLFYGFMDYLQVRWLASPDENVDQFIFAHCSRFESETTRNNRKNSYIQDTSTPQMSISNQLSMWRSKFLHSRPRQSIRNSSYKAYLCRNFGYGNDTSRISQLRHPGLPFYYNKDGTVNSGSRPSRRPNPLKSEVRYHKRHCCITLWGKLRRLRNCISNSALDNPSQTKLLTQLENKFQKKRSTKEVRQSIVKKLIDSDEKQLKFQKLAPNSASQCRNPTLKSSWPNIVHLCKTWYSALAFTVDFSGTIFGQGNVPTRQFYTGRLLVACWCLTSVLVVMMLRGQLASMLVASPARPTFHRFADVEARPDYRWGHYNSSFLPILQQATEPPLAPLYAGMRKFEQEDPDILAQTQEELVAKAAKEKFVAIIDSFFLDIIIREKGYQHVRVIPEILGTTGLGLNLPPDSELRDLMSEHIIAMVDKGLIDFFLKNTYQRLSNSAQLSKEKYMRPRQHASDTETLQLVRLCGPFLMVAAVVLLVELAIAWYLRKYRS